MQPDMRQVRQALEKLSFIEGVNLALALAPRLYTSWENIVRALMDLAVEAAQAEQQEESQSGATEQTRLREYVGVEEELP